MDTGAGSELSVWRKSIFVCLFDHQVLGSFSNQKKLQVSPMLSSQQYLDMNKFQPVQVFRFLELLKS